MKQVTCEPDYSGMEPCARDLRTLIRCCLISDQKTESMRRLEYECRFSD